MQMSENNKILWLERKVEKAILWAEGSWLRSWSRAEEDPMVFAIHFFNTPPLIE